MSAPSNRCEQAELVSAHAVRALPRSYVPAIEVVGGRAVFARLRHPDYLPDWNEVRDLVTPPRLKQQTRSRRLGVVRAAAK